MNFRFRIIVLAVLGLAHWNVNPGHAQTPQWKFAEGDTFAIRISQTSAVTTVVDRRVVEHSNEMTLEIDWVVESMDGENAQLTQTITRVIASLTMPGEKGPKTIEYDSNSERFTGDARRMNKSFSRIIGQPVAITITPLGEITDVKIPEETLESLRQMPGSMQGRKMFEPESIREMFAQAGMQLPSDTTGDSWETTREFSVGTPQKFNQTLSYTIENSGANPLEIGFTGTIAAIETTSPSERPEGIEFDSLEIEEQDSSGKIVFDTESGNCTSSESTTMLKTRTAYRDMAVVATINSTVNLTVQRK